MIPMHGDEEASDLQGKRKREPTASALSLNRPKKVSRTENHRTEQDALTAIIRDGEHGAAAEALFISAVRKFDPIGQDIMYLARAMVRGLMAEGLQREAQQNMRPYLELFIEEVQNGAS